MVFRKWVEYVLAIVWSIAMFNFFFWPLQSMIVFIVLGLIDYKFGRYDNTLEYLKEEEEND
jgi:hypothetical protein